MTECVISLGAVPARESYARLGETGYAERAFEECRRYEALEEASDGATALARIRRSAPDLGSYLELVVEYDDENVIARAYAIRCDREAPTSWE